MLLVSSASSNLLDAFFVCMGVTALAFTSLCVYRLFFHPYAKYPGPLLGKLTNYYAVYHSWKGDQHLDMWRCHEKYGPYVRYGPNELSINTAAGLKEIYAHGRNFKKSVKYNAMVHQAANTLTTIEKRKHGKKRRLISQAFSDAAFRSYEETIQEKISQLCTALRCHDDDSQEVVPDGTWGTAKNMSHWCDWFTFDVMCSVIFGVPWSSLTEKKYRHIPHTIEVSNVRVGCLIEAGGSKNLKIDKYLFPAAIAARNQFVKFVNDIIRQGMAMSAKGSMKGAFALLRDAVDPETQEPLSFKELCGESATLVVAGTDTTSTALAASLYYLTHHPKVYERAVQEVRSTFQSRDEIRLGPKVNSCSYLRAVIEETMRLSPSAPGPLWRQADVGGATVDGQYIPQGLEVATCVYSIHHSSEIYPQPCKFVPERWLGPEATPEPYRSEYSPHAGFNPFSIGPRGCIGKPLAYIELTLTLSHILYAFDMRLPPVVKTSEDDEYRLSLHITAAKEGPWVEFRPRAVV
ncbi:cytochrome P450 [Penicillium malachiteum]|uniref:cytochrome P450 n=1 Tax=Penicillium malachiteum TaxID=1324776 RepID=UPI00254705E6|nr:cytochrome P450 [Penicillium malachiteum]KAJ5714392.1 cytochrome P450 [Penicillium malachiteum]